MSASIITCVSAVAAQTSLDQYQNAANEVGEVFNSIGAVLNSGNADAAYSLSAAQRGNQAIASYRTEANNVDWSYSGPQAAQQQNANVQQYSQNSEIEDQRLYAMAAQAAAEEHANALRNPSQDANSPYGLTGAPKLQNKAVFRQNEMSTITDSSSASSAMPTNAAESKSESKESKSESKSSKEASKSESKESKEASKSASKESKSASKEATATATATAAGKNSTNSASPSPSSKKASGGKNTGTIATVSAGAVFVAISALL